MFTSRKKLFSKHNQVENSLSLKSYFESMIKLINDQVKKLIKC